MTLDRLDTIIAFAVVMLGISIMITLLNQIIASLLGHRGAYLRDGLIDLLTTLDPTLQGKVKDLVNSVLTHRLASDSIFARIPFAPKRWKLATAVRAEELSKLLNLCSAGSPIAPNISAILNDINPEITREANLIAQVVNRLGVPAATADQLIQHVSDMATNAVGRFDAAFQSTMDRISQRFTLQMRIWTIVFSMAFTLLYHTDAFALYSRIANEPVLRNALVNASDAVMKKAADLASPKNTEEKTKQNKDESAKQHKDENAKNNVDESTQTLVQSYQAMQKELSPANTQLIQIPERWYCWRRTEFSGLAVTAGFLSLGAPFWYNVLKTLTNLRPVVAKKQAEETGASS